MNHPNAKEVHIWSIPLDQANQVSDCAALLCADERARAARFYFERDRQRYTVGRAYLRLILSHYTGVSPAELRFEYNQYGKPALTAAQNKAAVAFNLSHTGGHALCAVTQGYAGGISGGISGEFALGIDVEEIRDLDYLQMAATVFSAQEQAVLRKLSPTQHPIAFFNGWTRKEAYIKAHGRGLSMPLADFDVTLAPDDPPRLLATRPDPTEVDNWSLYGWWESTNRAAALAVSGQDWQIVRHVSQELG